MVSASTESGRPGHLDPGQQHLVHKLREDVSSVISYLLAESLGILCTRSTRRRLQYVPIH